MLDKVASARALKRLFRRFPVADLKTLSRTLDTESRMSVFRRLKTFGYFSSYTHAGSFYTLGHIPQFDDYGLWMHQGIGFSKEGTLKATLLKLVETAPSGFTHTEPIASFFGWIAAIFRFLAIDVDSLLLPEYAVSFPLCGLSCGQR